MLLFGLQKLDVGGNADRRLNDPEDQHHDYGQNRQS
jgi:hypothetical protein